MKRLIPFIIFALSTILLYSCLKANDNIGHDGRCTGSANCSACSNCSRCGHCGSGGTCGACTGKSSGRGSSSGSSSKRYKTSDNHSSSKAKSGKSPKVRIDKVNININSNNRYLAGVPSLRIHEKPADQSNTVVTVTRNAKLILLEQKGEWYKVRVESSGKEGYVKREDVK